MSDSNKTVQVKLNSSRAGHRVDKNGKVCGMFSQATGDIVSMSSDEARRHVDVGLAEYVKKQQ